MLKSKITKTWSDCCDKWMYHQYIAYLDDDHLLQTTSFNGWSVEEVEQKTKKLSEALAENED